MEEFRIVALHPATATDEDIAAVHAVLSAAYAVDRPREPALPLGRVEIRIRHRRDDRRYLHYVATAAGTPVGVAALWLSDVDNLHMGLGNITVHPAYRGRGLATELLRTVAAAMVTQGRTVLLAETWAGTAGDGFPGAFGARLVAADRLSLLRLEDVSWADAERWATQEHPGYRAETYLGSLPEHRLESYARAKTAMNDAPTDDADVGDNVYTPETVRADEEVTAKLGELRLVLAVQEADDEIAGFTELVVEPGQSRAEQDDTAVVPAHRGHGLGLWIKAAMLVVLPAAHPAVTEILTGNAVSNKHMLAINDQLGFRPYAEIQGWQFDVADLTRRLG